MPRRKLFTWPLKFKYFHTNKETHTPKNTNFFQTHFFWYFWMICRNSENFMFFAMVAEYRAPLLGWGRLRTSRKVQKLKKQHKSDPFLVGESKGQSTSRNVGPCRVTSRDECGDQGGVRPDLLATVTFYPLTFHQKFSVGRDPLKILSNLAYSHAPFDNVRRI